MDKKLKAKWLKALRSGKYEQGDGYLKRVTDGGTEYCCLGVLCEISGIPCNGGVRLPTEFAREVGLTVYAALPEESPSSYFGFPLKGDSGHSLASANDNGLSFKRTANLIEKYL